MLCSAPLYYICQALSTNAAVRAVLILGVGIYGRGSMCIIAELQE